VGLERFAGVTHGDADAGCGKHGAVAVAKGNGVADSDAVVGGRMPKNEETGSRIRVNSWTLFE
jgi:hypothetical protein